MRIVPRHGQSQTTLHFLQTRQKKCATANIKQKLTLPPPEKKNQVKNHRNVKFISALIIPLRPASLPTPAPPAASDLLPYLRVNNRDPRQIIPCALVSEFIPTTSD